MLSFMSNLVETQTEKWFTDMGAFVVQDFDVCGVFTDTSLILHSLSCTITFMTLTHGQFQTLTRKMTQHY